ncbi:protein RCC2 homolog isoform X3 [Diaphorina citri]|uniref:Protein RCC2 homolog isoform X1 n=1 Tax=Diaphorina citri TaxID=121845 RepID=A0A3Q0JKS3_DIACI|nr:protein RCC2 homolog isoform X1 [Diaphorina citri]XP_026688971.1 protein RCC2 homolog isoform X2 [Diaphorina citri]XP_026688972.1 protein RCC2 homolog isoform X3 [Diaphorina citri]
MSSKRKPADVESARKKPKNSKNGKKKKQEEEEESDFEEQPSSGEEEKASDNEAEHYSDDEDSNLKIKGPELAGQLLLMGGMNWDLNGRKQVPVNGKANVGRNLYEPHIFGPLYESRVKVAVSSSCSAHNVVITEDNKCFTFGRNEKGQLGTGNTERRDQPFEPEELKNLVVVNAAVGKNHTLFLTERGHVYACGDNQFGQCGIKSKQATVLTPTRIKYSGPPIVKIGCGGDFSMILNIKGVLYSFGLPEYGQLGLGATGEYIQTAGKVMYNCERAPVAIKGYIEKGKDNHPKVVEVTDIVDFSCGPNHTVALDSQKRAFSWGYGAYGRLGHADNKDELLPRLIKFFDSQNRGVKAVYCGATYTFAINDLGQTFLFGVTKKTGEANMYPKPFHDLSGWNVRSIGCAQTSVVVAADETTIVWGSAPCYGELGLGDERKSAASPVENKLLAKTHIHSVSCGICHTLLIARNDTEEEKDGIADRFDEYEAPKP